MVSENMRHYWQTRVEDAERARDYAMTQLARYVTQTVVQPIPVEENIVLGED